jgi:hypothetical protein
MYLTTGEDRSLVEVLSTDDLFNPFQPTVRGRLHAGEELQDAETFRKADLSFPSGEALPRCWTDPEYRSDVGQPAAARPVALR